MSHQSTALEVLLNDTKRIVKHQDEIKILRGENFNIFSILKVESKENSTHTAFIGELLNPDGSHLFKTTFLEYFLKTIGFSGTFDIASAKLILEKHIGERNHDLKKGGRIDIYIVDAKENSICIENKIYATDQENQIQRYVNHNLGKNSVYYLTLQGNDASEHSKGELKNNQDYYCISYKRTIIDWLEECLKASVEQPILRESIKQYILLLKKMTNQLSDSTMDKEIQELIIRNYQSAKLIEGNVWKIEKDATYQFLLDVKTLVQNSLGSHWIITVDEELDNSWTGLKITHPDWNGIQVKLEGDSKIPWTRSIYGINALNTEWDRTEINKKTEHITLLQTNFKSTKYWPYYKHILSFFTTEERARLFDNDKRKDLVKEISDLLIELSKECEMPLSNIKKLKA
jgi:hypothetical protein